MVVKWSVWTSCALLLAVTAASADDAAPPAPDAPPSAGEPSPPPPGNEPPATPAPASAPAPVEPAAPAATAPTTSSTSSGSSTTDAGTTKTKQDHEAALSKRRFRERIPGFLAKVGIVYASTKSTEAGNAYTDSGGGLTMGAEADWLFGNKYAVGVWFDSAFGANVTEFGYLGHIHFGLELAAAPTPDVELRLRYGLQVYANSLRDVGAGDDVYVAKLLARYTKYVAQVGYSAKLFAFPRLGEFGDPMSIFTVGGMTRLGTAGGYGIWAGGVLDLFSASDSRLFNGQELRLSLMVTGI